MPTAYLTRRTLGCRFSLPAAKPLPLNISEFSVISRRSGSGKFVPNLTELLFQAIRVVSVCCLGSKSQHCEQKAFGTTQFNSFIGHLSRNQQVRGLCEKSQNLLNR
jgi:hypothetical protein